MEVIQPLELESSFKTFGFKEKQYLTISTKLFFPLEGGLPIPFSDAYSKISSAPSLYIDEGMPKTEFEYFIIGCAQSPNRKTVQAMDVNVVVDGHKKSIRVIGDRYWVGGITGATEPKAFIEMPLNWENAFGGKDHSDNIDGKGLDYKDTDLGQKLIPLPNLEYPNKLVTSQSQRPPAACFMPRATNHPERSKLLGSFNEHWLTYDFPGYPKDLDFKAFNCAPDDQIIPKPNNEHFNYELAGLNHAQPTIKGKLPRYTIKSFLLKSNVEAESITQSDVREVKLGADTVVFYPNQNIGCLIYRGTIECNDVDAHEYSTLMTGYEEIGQPKPADHYLHSLRGRLSDDTRDLFALSTKDLIPEHIPCTLARLSYESENPIADSINSQIDEYTQNAKQTIANKLEQLINEQSLKGASTTELHSALTNIATEQKADPWQIKLEEILKKIIPVLDKESSTYDLSQIDFRAFTELQDHMETKAKVTEENIAQKLMQQAKDEEKSNPQLSKQLYEAANDLEKPPYLPRIEPLEKQIEVYKHKQSQIEQHNQTLANQGLTTIPSIDIDGITNVLTENHAFATQQYQQTAHLLPKGRLPHDQTLDSIEAEFMRRVNSGESVQGMDLAGVNLSNLDLSRINMDGCLLEQANLSNTILKNASLVGAVLTGANLTDAKLDYCNLENANIGQCTVRGTSFEHANMDRCEWGNTEFVETSFSHLDLSTIAYTLEVAFKRCKFDHVIFNELSFIEADFSGSEFNQCDLINTTFEQCELSGTKYIQCNLTESIYIDSQLSLAEFTDCCSINSRWLGGSTANEVKILRSDFTKSSFRDATLDRCLIINSNLFRSDFADSSIRNAVINGCNIKESDFMNANLSSSDVSNNNFMESVLMQSNLFQTNLSRCNFYGVEFMGAKVAKTDFSSSIMKNTKLADWRPSKWH